MAERQGKKVRKKPTKSDPEAEEEKARTAKPIRSKTTKKTLHTYKHMTEDKAPPLPQATINNAGSFVEWASELGIDGLVTLFSTKLLLSNPPTQPAAGFSLNPTKNRYQDVVCLEDTRVVLKKEKPDDGDYIHANWIRFHDHDRVYIATQGPLENTIEDFWRMVWQEKTMIVVNLTKCVEEGKSKCAQYWPDKEGEYKTYGRYSVTLKKLEKEDKDRLLIYTLEVLPEGCSDSLVVRMIHTTHWGDGQAMHSSYAILRLIKSIFSVDKLSKAPVVIHCSAGIGRTGTLVLIDYLLLRLFSGKHINLEDAFKHLRTQRASSVQREGQFVYIVIAAVAYISTRIPKKFDQQRQDLEKAFKDKKLNAG